MERYSVILPPDDSIRSTNTIGIYGRCIRWNFADDWLLFNQGMGLPPLPRELWISIYSSHTEAMQTLITEAKRVREKLLQSLSGLATGINIDEGSEIGAKGMYEEQSARMRKQSLLIAPGTNLPKWTDRDR